MGLTEEQRRQAAHDIFDAERTLEWTTPVSLRGDAGVVHSSVRSASKMSWAAWRRCSSVSPMISRPRRR